MVSAMEQKGTEKELWLLSREELGPLLRRLIVVIVLIDFAGMVILAQWVMGNLTDGFFWGGSPGSMLFPIPIRVYSFLPVLTPLSPIDSFVYVVFIWNDIWIAWTAVAVLYIVYPALLKLKSASKKA
ncbi:MAG: hypothetical protein C4K47_08690 [Candidatus Thorarchaeota archaeon]|nr:MAG: hypothetical protein C4K47_08690 [Candidatus Thorarchaeota archaeon]